VVLEKDEGQLDHLKMKYSIKSRKKRTTYIQKAEGKLTGMITSCVEMSYLIEGKVEGTTRRGRRHK
jgi:hypothetical protein